tara:strand:- start:607 stop:1401 length:795 start_codon:yes stop_codon:yes gene_type:complete
MADIKGNTGQYETEGSTVEIGDHKETSAIGASVKWVQGSSTIGSWFKGGTTYGDMTSATAETSEGTISGTTTYKDKGKSEPTYSMKVSTATEPIDTHPLVGQIIGDINAPMHQAIFEKDGTFKQFPAYFLQSQAGGKAGMLNAKGGAAEWGDQNRMAGVASYLSAGAIWTKSYKQKTAPKLSGLGKISSPAGDAPTPDGRSWLYTGFNASFTSPSKDEDKTTEGTISQEWKLSGRNGWDVDIYGEGDGDEGGGAPMGGGGGAGA